MFPFSSYGVNGIEFYGLVRFNSEAIDLSTCRSSAGHGRTSTVFTSLSLNVCTFNSEPFAKRLPWIATEILVPSDAGMTRIMILAE